MPLDHLYILVYFLPDKPWNWPSLSRRLQWDLLMRQRMKDSSEDGTSDLAITLPHSLVIDFSDISSNPTITWEIVKNTLHSPFEGPDYNPCAHIHENWDFRFLSLNPAITIENIKDSFDHPEYGETIYWEWRNVSQNLGIKWPDIIDNLYDDRFDWDWTMISARSDITMDIVEENPEFPWDYRGLSHNPNLTWKFVSCRTEKEWDKDGLIMTNIGIVYELFKLCSKDPFSLLPNHYSSTAVSYTYPGSMVYSTNDKYFLWSAICGHKNIEIEFLVKNMGKYVDSYDWNTLTLNLSVQLKIFKDYLWGRTIGIPSKTVLKRFFINHLTMDISLFKRLLRKKILESKKTFWRPIRSLEYMIRLPKECSDPFRATTLESIKEAIHLPLDWKEISERGDLTYRDILNNLDLPWDWERLSINSFDTHNAAIKIQRIWRRKKDFLRWKRGIKDVNMNILFSPHIPGVEFLRSKKEFEFLYPE